MKSETKPNFNANANGNPNGNGHADANGNSNADRNGNGHADANGKPATILCADPATGQFLGEVPVVSAPDVRSRVVRARAAQQDWHKTTFAERRRVLRTLLDHILLRQEEICRLASRDSGKTLVDAAMGEIFPVCEKLRYTIAHGERDLSPERRSAGLLVHKAARVEYQPLGVIGVICPWNFPFHNILCPTIPALFAGNAVVAKVSEWTSWSAADYQAIFDEVLRSTGHSPDLVQLITGFGETGSALVTSGVDKIFFTGSPGNGKKVMAAAADTLTPVVLELGGKDPMIICDDADLSQAVASAMMGVFTACGQMCVAAERLYVHDGIYDRFVAEVIARVEKLRQGAPADDAGGQFDVGAMTMPAQLEIIESQIADAVKKGARVRVGGKRNPALKGQFFLPTVLTEVTHEMAILREETFGPVMTIVRVQSDDEAVRLANDTRYGLGSSVFSKSRKRAEKIAAQLSAGMTVINDYGVAYMAQALPFGGVRISGFGRINGKEGLRACCNEKTVVSDRLPIHPALALYPVGKGTYRVLKSAVSLIYSDGIVARARVASQIVARMLRRS